MDMKKTTFTIKSKLSLLISLLILVFGCVDYQKNSAFNIKIDLVLQKTDSIHVYYKNDGSINFNETEAFWVKVKGNPKNQNVTINFPKNIIPNQFRLDLGNDKKQPEIVLNKITLCFKDKARSYKGEEIYTILRVDESNTILEKSTGILKRKNKERKAGPSLYPNGDRLYKALQNLYNQK